MILPNKFQEVSYSEVRTQPTRTYGINFRTKRITGFIDSADAMMQAVKKIIYTERFVYSIYDASYGIELQSLFGGDHTFAQVAIGDRIKDALLMDTRILSVENIEVKVVSIDSLYVSCKVNTVFGEIDYETEVK